MEILDQLGESVERGSEQAGARRGLQQAEVDVEHRLCHLRQLLLARCFVLLRLCLQQLAFHFFQLLRSLNKYK